MRVGLRSPTWVEPYNRKARMRYRFVTDLFGLRLDKERFQRDFGVPVERGLWAELAFMRMAGGIATDTPTEITLTPVGRYLLLVMMRETLAASNDHRDHAARAAACRGEAPSERRR